MTGFGTNILGFGSVVSVPAVSFTANFLVIAGGAAGALTIGAGIKAGKKIAKMLSPAERKKAKEAKDKKKAAKKTKKSEKLSAKKKSRKEKASKKAKKHLLKLRKQRDKFPKGSDEYNDQQTEITNFEKKKNTAEVFRQFHAVVCHDVPSMI